MFLCPQGWIIFGENKETKNVFVKGTPEYESHLNLFKIGDNVTSIFGPDEEVTGYHFSDLKGLDIKN